VHEAAQTPKLAYPIGDRRDIRRRGHVAAQRFDLGPVATQGLACLIQEILAHVHEQQTAAAGQGAGAGHTHPACTAGDHQNVVHSKPGPLIGGSLPAQPPNGSFNRRQCAIEAT
jgi:hypothetical protein